MYQVVMLRDVGQGDSALVVTPHGHAFMIDTGGTSQGTYDIGTKVDVPYLLHYGVRKLDFIMLTHAHEDHAGGVGGILQKIPVGTVLIGHEGVANYRRTFGESPAVRRESMTVLQEGTEMTLDGVRIQILYAPAENKTGSNTGNEFSNLIRVSYGQHSFLFTGDLSKEHEAILVQRGTPLASTVLKVGHHGSDTSSSEAFLRAVKPKWSVISVGYGNSFGHPREEIISRLHRCTGSEILRTDEQGAVVFATDGEKLRVNTQIVYDDKR
ncbi:ComEC/Rec2 family competence protein [Anaerovibrio sp. JC8]|uniref:ComEC/Rec2 family competence protein n=1 Tax=Anaerovibrio sp. JC8 TaxID=1240085 RepID=UPI0011787D91|nr:ComEC/Rec2 family competence protein [Anaerovibrio sp. JC8]